MDKTLVGKAALITGGGGGFGTAIAIRLASDGAAVTVMGRTEQSLAETARAVAEQVPDAPEVRWHVGDASSDNDVAAAVALADERQLAMTVCTVGGGTMSPLLALSSETLKSDFDRNVVSALIAIRHSVAAMVPHGGGSIVCISSTAGGFSFPFMGSYSVAKAGLEALVRVAADEVGRLGVRVNAVRPGLVPTKAAKPGLIASDPKQLAAVLREKPLSRVGTAEDIAEAVRYLVGAESAWVTGTVLPVEGGNHLRRAADLEVLARSACGDDVVDAALRGTIPEVSR